MLGSTNVIPSYLIVIRTRANDVFSKYQSLTYDCIIHSLIILSCAQSNHIDKGKKQANIIADS